MTPALQQLFDVSTRIREYEAAADTITALARLATDVQVRASLQQQALELVQTAGTWRKRQDDELSDARRLRGAICPHGFDGCGTGCEACECNSDLTRLARSVGK